MTSTANTRDRVLSVSMKLFSEKGFGATSIQDILNSADVHAGSLYHFFPTKQDLLIAVLARYRDGLFPMLLDPAWKGVDDPVERIFALLAKYRARLVATDFFYGCPIGSIALEIHEPDPAVRELLAVNFTNWCAAIEQCLDGAGGRIPDDVDKKELASFVLTTMEGAVMQSRTHRSAVSFDAAVQRLRDYFIRMGALPQSERRNPRPTKPATRSKR